MKTTALLILLCVFTALASGQNQMSADAVLKKSADKLTALKTVKYKYKRELNYASEKFFAESIADSFLDFTTSNNVLGARFQFNGKDYISIFNGSEQFDLSKKDKTISVNNKPTLNDLSSSSYMGGSPITLKNLFPTLIENKAIAKTLTETTLNGAKVYVIEFSLENQWFNKLGQLAPAELKNKHTYRISIRQNDFLPVEMLQKLNDTDFMKSSMSEIEPNAAAPVESSWYYSSYLNEYAYAKPPENKLIKAGETAPEINLPLFATDKLISLNDYKGKLVLLDFWIFHCGYCQESVPKLNALQKKYKNKDFKLLTINVHDTKDLIELFIKTKKAEFEILYKGEDTATKFGVSGFPTVFLIGKDGKIIYSGSYDAQKLDDLIAKNL